ncbi:hypothetical protein [Cryobacterium tepidiphilum]|uniref:TIGR02569 family protein n=1 Tax=Cryobacterium tepidiphilum TaxID=2486026 RepID=A0A3M8LQ92_9MICO|nr:hypothetical protein [Cryobacterium tepidiphilum]RNE67009.1 hypothetical protein EEJ31_02045 [Cryobacterium tepidiphilum]
MPGSSSTTEQPPPEVLRAFGATGVPHRLPGGQGTTWQCGDLVLKPRDMPAHALDWLAGEVAPRLRSGEIRAALPLPARSGGFEIGGWTAFPALPGSHLPGRWLDIIAAGRRFSDLCAGVSEPSFIRARTDAWARGDRIAWGEETVAQVEAVPEIARIRSVLQPVEDTPTLVHGDLTGNVLFHDDLPPAIIDLSLYWRPAAYASAIVVVDAITFEGAPTGLVQTAATAPAFGQYLLRAIVFRLATDSLTGRSGPGGPSAYRRAIDSTLAFLGSGFPC